MAQFSLLQECLAHLTDVTIAPLGAKDTTRNLDLFANTALAMMAAPVPLPAAWRVMCLAEFPPENTPAASVPAPMDVLPSDVALLNFFVMALDVVPCLDDTNMCVAPAVLLWPALLDRLTANTEKANMAPPELP